MKIYVLRHGQTNWNLEGKLQGKKDIPLNETGIRQAEEVNKKLANLDLDLVVSSPLTRAMQTAKIAVIDREIPIVCDERIIERGYGKIEGKYFKNLDMSKFFNFYEREECKKYDIESIKDVYERVKVFLDELKQKEYGKDILIVTHGGTIRAINVYFEGIPEDGNMDTLEHKNCQIKEYEL